MTPAQKQAHFEKTKVANFKASTELSKFSAPNKFVPDEDLAYNGHGHYPWQTVPPSAYTI